VYLKYGHYRNYDANVEGSSEMIRCNIIREHLEALGARPQLIMFMTGAGGSGKSNVISAFFAYCKEFCQNLGAHFDSRTIIITAITGVAATSIMGETTSKALGLTKTSFDSDFIKKYANTRMVLIDEISFCKGKELEQLDRSLKIVKEEPNLVYGGIHMIFCGDFHQLPPVGEGSIWEDYRVLWHAVINSFIELEGKWRFKEDEEWGEILGRLRMSTSTSQDIAVINSRVIEVL
jgi:ATP-dependent DNA helicase PIF1